MTDSQVHLETSIDLVVRDLGRMAYAEAFELQKRLQQEVIAQRDQTAGPRRMHLLLVEHDPPVITISRRKTAAGNLVATPQQLAAAGVEVAQTDRGGDITYHGPGQLVAYPILDLNILKLRLHSYMRLLEQIVIDTIGVFGVEGYRDPEATGVWVKSSHEPCAMSHEEQDSRPKTHDPSPMPQDSSSKIAALGVRVSRWVSMHGLALNVNPDLDHFNLIVPCGLAGRTVTCLHNELPENCPTMDEVKKVLVEQFESAIAQHRSK